MRVMIRLPPPKKKSTEPLQFCTPQRKGLAPPMVPLTSRVGPELFSRFFQKIKKKKKIG